MEDAIELGALTALAFLAGAVNAVAGGGSLISFPGLLAAGYDAKPANVTNTVALWPGYLGGSIGYREELRAQRSRTIVLIAPSVLGALAGSAILLATPGDVFEGIAPFLILFACVVLWFQDRLAALTQTHSSAGASGSRLPATVHIGAFALAVYGAYFGAGLGILMLALLGILIADELQHLNALKGFLSLVTNAVAVIYFALFGPVQWAPALLMAAGALAGGYFGVGAARRLGRELLRLVVVVYGVAAAILMLVT
ncbi:MAG TPA: sulfite exporter TauE/SafE family protein [Dehalococcoidia bacterium]|nr:sulfite exporter TauE/SafE family protein [Dehalococcoidia bacterium]